MPRDAVAVVGASGVMGRELVSAALDAGYDVRACVREGSDVSALEAKGGARLTVHRSPSGLPPPAALAVAAVLCAVAGRANRTCSTPAMRAVEVDLPISLYRACCASSPPPARAVFFTPALGALAAARGGGGAPPASEYLTAKEDMVRGLRAAEAAAASGGGGGGGAPSPRVTIVQVAAWGRDVGPIVAAAAAAPPWLPALPIPILVPGWWPSLRHCRPPRLAPLAEADLAARVVRGLGSAPDGGATLCLGGPEPVTHAQLWGAALAGLGRGDVRLLALPLPAAAVRAAARSPALTWLAARSGRPTLRAGLYLARIAADAAGADLVGEEAVEGAAGVADIVRAEVARVRGGSGQGDDAEGE